MRISSLLLVPVALKTHGHGSFVRHRRDDRDIEGVLSAGTICSGSWYQKSVEVSRVELGLCDGNNAL